MRDADQFNPERSNGYIVTLNTLAKFYSDTREDLYNYSNSMARKYKDKNDTDYKKYFKDRKSYVTFGDFDRTTFAGVNRFSKFYDLDEKFKFWLGKHQNVFLYRIECDNLFPQLYPYTYYYEKKNEYDHGFFVKKSDHESLYQSTVNQKLEGESSFFPFFVLTQISFSNEVITRVGNYADFIKTIKINLTEILNRLIEHNSYNVYFEVYGCMNSSEIAILWLCKKYDEVFNLIDYLKDFTVDELTKDEKHSNNLFFSFYSVVGITLINATSQECSSEVEKEERRRFQEAVKSQITGKANISITVGDEYNVHIVEKSIRDKFKEKANYEITETKLMGGEYDLRMSIDAKEIYFQFNELYVNSDNNGIFRDKEVRKGILGIKTDLLSDIQEINVPEIHGEEDRITKEIVKKAISLKDSFDIADEVRVTQFNDLYKELSPDKDKYLILQEGIKPESVDVNTLPLRSLYRLIRHCFKIDLDSHTGSVDTLDMLYADYLSNIHDTFNALWRNDYHYQFKKSLLYLYYLLSSNVDNKQLPEDFWKSFTKTIDNIRQQTVHFSQSGRLVMQIPATHLRYTANADLLFHSYYGMVKAILEAAYGKQADSTCYQSELLPIITTNSTPKITSELYKAGKECDDLRILQIDLPYSLLFDPITGFPHMVHELFHYFAPNDRRLRNTAILEIAVNESIAVIYCEQLTEGIKEYLYNLYIGNPQKLYDLGFPQDRNYESSNSEDYNKDFEKFMGKSANGATSERARVLRIALSRALWDDKEVIKVRKSIVNDIIYDKDHKVIPEKTTWNESLDSFRKRIKNLSAEHKMKISTSIIQCMQKYESELNQETSVKKKIGLKTYKFIRTCDVASDEINKMMYEHKFRMLNPYHIRPTKEIVFNYVEDVFLKGVREATPDFAMVKYCGLSDIEYLVTYARFTHDNGLSTIAEYDVVRLMLVLCWMQESVFTKYKLDKEGNTILEPQADSLPVNDEIPEEMVIFSGFAFQDKGKEFVEHYIAEYMPHILIDDEKDNRAKICEIFFTALKWFYNFCEAADKFSREYGIYFEQIDQLRKAYNFYFDDNRYNGKLNKLVDVIKDHRTNKVDKRKSLIENQWSVVDKYILEIRSGKFKKEYSKKQEEFKKEFLAKDFIDANKYKKIADTYDIETFWKILEFVHVSAAQKTLKQLGEQVPKKKDVEVAETPEGNAGDGKTPPAQTDTTEERKRLERLIEHHTVYDAWGLGGFSKRLHRDCLYLNKDSEESNVWFKVIDINNKILPVGLQSEKKKYGDTRLCDIVQRSLQSYLIGNESALSHLNDYEAVAKMTIDKPDRDSNLIVWKGDLLSSMLSCKDYNLENSSNKEAVLLLFSPNKYMKCRNEVVSEESTVSIFIKYTQNDSPQILFNKQQINEDTAQYLLVNTSYELRNVEPFRVLEELNEINIALFYPQPIIDVGLDEKGRFLAYNLLTNVDNVGVTRECIEELELSNLQDSLLRRIINKKKDRYSQNQIIEEYAFLYKIKIKKEIFDEFMLLTKGV